MPLNPSARRSIAKSISIRPSARKTLSLSTISASIRSLLDPPAYEIETRLEDGNLAAAGGFAGKSGLFVEPLEVPENAVLEVGEAGGSGRCSVSFGFSSAPPSVSAVAAGPSGFFTSTEPTCSVEGAIELGLTVESPTGASPEGTSPASLESDDSCPT